MQSRWLSSSPTWMEAGVPSLKKLIEELKRCGKRKDLKQGKLVHSQAVVSGLDRNTYIANTLISMYCKCGNTQEARDVFDRMTQRTVVSWNALLFGYVKNRQSSVALDVFQTMDCPSDKDTFVAAVKACTGLLTEAKVSKESCLVRVAEIHKHVRDLGFDSDMLLACTLVDIYSKCGDMRLAREVFDGMRQRDVVSWNALLLGYVNNGQSLAALELFRSMNCAPDTVTFVAGLKACAGLLTETKLSKESCLENGVAVHQKARELGCEKDMLVASTLVDMYSKCGDMELARQVFDRMTERDVVAWNALLLGYVNNGQGSEALNMYKRMRCKPDTITYVAALKACASVGALEMGRRIHNRVRELKLEQDEMLSSCLVDFYGKCGDMQAAEEVFSRLRSPDVVTWNALIGGYTLRGDFSLVFAMIKKMQDSGLKMNGVTMLLVLTACSHTGMVEEGKTYFESMHKRGLTPTLEHYNCLVDILGRANKLEDAVSVVNNMPLKAETVTWKCLLGACKKWNNVDVGKVAFDALLATSRDEREVAAAYVLMGDIYGSLGRLEDRDKINNERPGDREPFKGKRSV